MKPSRQGRDFVGLHSIVRDETSLQYCATFFTRLYHFALFEATTGICVADAAIAHRVDKTRRATGWRPRTWYIAPSAWISTEPPPGP
jgi:hypothetical protein